MRIIDKNTDYYDYLSNVYRDNSLTFDRHNSFLLTKEDVCSKLNMQRKYRRNAMSDFLPNYLLLQIGPSFWLLKATITKTETNKPSDISVSDYSLELIHHWKDYDAASQLICFDVITFNKLYYLHTLNDFLSAVKHSEFRVCNNLCEHECFIGSGRNVKTVKKTIPILTACGISDLIQDIDIYLAFEEYFSLQKTESERRESIGLTDKEKVINHGFDAKSSFRGK